MNIIKLPPVFPGNLDEDNVSDRYLVGLLAPQQRRINLEQQD